MRLAARRQRPPPGEHSITRMLPNVLTTLGLSAGMSAIRFAILHRWEAAVIAIAVAAILDVLDGRTARFLNAQSKFGAELDSLSDVVCFGVSPAILLYLWGLHGAGNFGWLAALALGICAALRLARFNSALVDGGVGSHGSRFFTGVPTPAGAGIALLPMVVDFEADLGIGDHPVFVALWAIGASLLMVSTLPTFSLHGIRVKHRVPVLALIGIVAGAVVSAPWSTLACLGFAYLASVPVAYWRHKRFAEASGTDHDDESGGIGVPDQDELIDDIHEFHT